MSNFAAVFCIPYIGANRTQTFELLIMCEGLGVRFQFTTLCKILETCPSASHVKQLLEAMQQNKTTVLGSKNILITMLNSSIHRIFQRKLLLQTESCTVQSVEVYSQSSFIAILSNAQMPLVLSVVKWNDAYYTKNVIFVFIKS